MSRIVFDIESNGYLEDATRMWMLASYDLDTKEEKQYLEGDLSWQAEFDKATMLAGYNEIAYDLNVLEKLFGWTPKPHTSIHDALLFSQMMNFRRFGFEGHSLERWGRAFGDYKGSHTDFSQYSQGMHDYCVQDVRLTVKVYKYLMAEFVNASRINPLLVPSMRNEHNAARFMAKSQLRGWLFDKVKGIELLWKMQEEIDAAQAMIEPLLGLKTIAVDKVNGVVDVKYPKWTKKGYYHQHIANWFNIPADDGQWEDCLVEGPYCRVVFEPRKLSSGDDVKHWLYSIGWVADDWNYKRNEETRRMEVVSDKISETSLQALGEIGEVYNQYLTTQSRANILRGWIEACDDDWRVHGSAMCFGTPTGRMTHKVIANVPSVENAWGGDVRSLFMADPGTVIIGCDSSGNQMRAFCHHLGNAEFTAQVLDGDIHQANADVLTLVMKNLGYDFVVTRKQGKTFIYAFLFGVGAEKAALYIAGKRDATLGAKIKAGFAENVVGLAELNAKLESIFGATKRDFGLGYIYALDGGKIFSDSFHKVLNYLLQRFESVTVKCAVFHMMKKLSEEGIWFQPLIIYHDEVQFLVKNDPAIIQRAKEIAKWAFRDAAQEFNVIITDGEAKHGANWKETH